MCDNSKLRQSFALKSKQRFGDKYTCVSYVRKQGVRRYDATLVCNTHGIEFKIESSNHLRSEKGGCPKCVYEDRFPDLYKDSKRKCSKCNEYKDVIHFANKGNNKVSSYCKECHRDRNRARNMNPDVLEKKRAADRERAKKPEIKAKKVENSKKYRRLSDAYKEWLKGRRKYESDLVEIKCTCGNSFIVAPRENNRTKCNTCINREAKRKYYKHKVKGQQLVCAECKRQFIGSGGKQKHCETCAKMLSNRNKVRGSHEQRAKKYGVVVKYVNPTKVFNRDKWRCKLCGCKVQKKDIYADNAAELDHIVPISIGGPHTYSNVQTACRKCNNEKQNSYKGQLVMGL